MIIFVSFSLLIGYAASVCYDGWTARSSSCYYFSKTALSWDLAQAYCHDEFGAHLVEIETAAENSYLESASQQFYNPNSTGDSGHIYGYWIGGRKDITTQIWKWAGSQTNFTYKDWSPGEPNHRGHNTENCVHVASHQNFHWNNYVCSRSEFFICESSTETTDTETGTGIIG